MKKIHIFLIFLFALVARFIALDQSLWLDEATTARVVTQYDYFGIISKFSITDFHPPLYYIFMKFWTGLFGASEIALRMPSILFSLAAGWLIYLMAGVWAAAFFLFNPLIIYYSQEARMYMMAAYLLTGALYYFRRLSDKNIPNTIFFNVFLILSFYTFYGSIFFIVPMFLYLLYKKQYRVFIASAMMFGAYVAVLMPLTLAQLKSSRVALSQVTNWASVLGTANLKNLMLIPMKFSIGRIDFYPKVIYYAVSGVWTMFVLFGLRSLIKKENRMWTILLVSPLALGLVFSLFSPLLQYFRFLYLIPVMAIILSITKDTKKHLYKTILVSGFLVFSFAYLFIPQFHREDWKGLSNNLDDRTPVYMIISSSDPLTYYRKDLKIKDIKELSNLVGEKSVTVLPYTADVHGVDYKKILTDKGYEMKKATSFRDLTSETWVR
jgi:uncharacterized membrane protein